MGLNPSSARTTPPTATVTSKTVGLRRVMVASSRRALPRVAVNSTSSSSSGGSAGAGEGRPLAAAPPPVAGGSLAAGPALDKAARRFAAGVKAGLSPDEMTAMELAAGASSGPVAELTEAQRAYAQAVRARLEQRAAELAREDAARRAREARNFEAGKLLYERGEYRRCVEALELAVEDAGGKGTQLGGEAAMWLALGYQAVGREQDCGDLYRWLEQNHPNKRLRKQAGDLRYILEAPKLELSPDERVTVPVISSADAWKAGGRRSSVSSSLRKKGGGGGGGEKKPWERDVTGAGILPDAWYVRVAWVVVIVGTGVYGNHVAALQREQQQVAAAGAVGQTQQQQPQQPQQQRQAVADAAVSSPFSSASSSAPSGMMARQAPPLRL